MDSVQQERNPFWDIPLKEHVKGQVKFCYYRDGNLYYVTETRLLFPVPVDDTGSATFKAEDKAILFMRYIRKFLEKNKGI